ncbi:macrophage mannose receptor 1-like [Astyanax mexicanus]|uniref:Macrophage mannose receptor 1-like n=2 Tax=Astyanax mexicanus TaxID=7994 RepID=A0A8T2LY17_ASTMX|nr:macrophage mannose receptor 1-like [Astyanax mexicanus]
MSLGLTTLFCYWFSIHLTLFLWLSTVMRSALHCLLLFSALWTLSFCGTRQFHVVNVKKEWDDAQQYCSTVFTDLATIDSQEEMDNLKVALNGAAGNFWIGLKQKVDNTDSWIWSDGIDDSYNNWTPGQPDSLNSEKCVMLRSVDEYKWHNADCSIQNLFICYKDLVPLVLITAKKTWREALSYCRENHVDLVSVHTEEIQRRVEAVIKVASTDNVWVGLRHTCSLSFWFWVSGNYICYQNWAPGNGTGEEDCSGVDRSGAVQSKSKQWISLLETQTLNFICVDKV